MVDHHRARPTWSPVNGVWCLFMFSYLTNSHFYNTWYNMFHITCIWPNFFVRGWRCRDTNIFQDTLVGQMLLTCYARAEGAAETWRVPTARGPCAQTPRRLTPSAAMLSCTWVRKARLARMHNWSSHCVRWKTDVLFVFSEKWKKNKKEKCFPSAGL